MQSGGQQALQAITHLASLPSSFRQVYVPTTYCASVISAVGNVDELETQRVGGLENSLMGKEVEGAS